GNAMADVSITYTVSDAVVAILRATQTVDGTLNTALSEAITITNTNPMTAPLIAGSCVLLEPTGDTALAQTTPGSNEYTVAGLTLTTDAINNTCIINGTPNTAGATILRIRATTAEGMSEVLELTVYARVDDTVSFAQAMIAVNFGSTPAANLPTATSSSTATFTWTSSDEMVATIDADTGAITLTGGGTTTITATSVQSDTHKPDSATYLLNVTQPPSLVAATSTVVDNTPLALPLSVENAIDGADITECFFIDTANSDAQVATLDDLSIEVATNGRACEITGKLNGAGVKPAITIRALSTTGQDETTVTFTVEPKPLGLVRQLSGYTAHTCAVSADAELYCWGLNTNGELGLGDVANRNTPTRVGIATNWSQVGASASHTCAINDSDELYCWGSNSIGQLGLGASNMRNTPIKVGTNDNWSQISTSATHTCAINDSDALYCWGSNNAGQLGLGDSNMRNTPIKVGTNDNWSQISGGDVHTCAINNTNEIYCWGSNDFGQAGTASASDTPAKVGNATNWSQISGGQGQTCAVNTIGELYCWGIGVNGRLGLGDTDNRNTPTKVGTATNWMQVSTGFAHSCAVNTIGEIYCWGSNNSGELGSASASNTPIKVGNATNWSQVSVPDRYTCAVNFTGQLFCWGSGDSGRLGLGDTSGRNTPTPVTTARTPTTAPVLANLTLTGPAGVFGAGSTIPALTYTNTGGDVQPDGCAIDTTNSRPDLPAGLRAHPIVSGTNVTCQISGIPTAATAMATYYLTATNAIGTSEAVTVSFQVDLVRPLLADAPTEQSYAVGTAITPLTFTNTGLAVKATAGCAVSRALPAGLTIAAFDDAGKMTCQIAGNPSAAAAKATYVITATATDNSTDEARVTITVSDPL
ncbi:MAG: hypothetical protein K8963_10380, partial [Proteobacteria bacterium]|nr:hypothetical protein [Pseudomonadota bacterium]